MNFSKRVLRFAEQPFTFELFDTPPHTWYKLLIFQTFVGTFAAIKIPSCTETLGTSDFLPRNEPSGP